MILRCSRPSCLHTQTSTSSLGFFQSLEQILASEQCPSLNLLSTIAAPCLALVCDIKTNNGDAYYRLNDDKACLQHHLLTPIPLPPPVMPHASLTE